MNLKHLQQFYHNLLVFFQDQLGTNTNAIKFKIMGDEMEDKVGTA